MTACFAGVYRDSCSKGTLDREGTSEGGSENQHNQDLERIPRHANLAKRWWSRRSVLIWFIFTFMNLEHGWKMPTNGYKSKLFRITVVLYCTTVSVHGIWAKCYIYVCIISLYQIIYRLIVNLFYLSVVRNRIRVRISFIARYIWRALFQNAINAKFKKKWVRHAILLCTEPIHCSINVSCQIARFPCLKCTARCSSFPNRYKRRTCF